MRCALNPTNAPSPLRRFVFDDEALEVVIAGKEEQETENKFVGGRNRWTYDTFINWELWWPAFPVLVYFKESQTKPEGQIHFFPVIFNGKELYDVMLERWDRGVRAHLACSPCIHRLLAARTPPRLLAVTASRAARPQSPNAAGAAPRRPAAPSRSAAAWLRQRPAVTHKPARVLWCWPANS
jgi:hypothetical protein